MPTTDQYKKSYEGDYTKSYKDIIARKIERLAQKKEYQTISKKLNDQPYNKKERSASYSNDMANTRSNNAERVYADGSSRQRDRGQIKRVWDDSSTYTPNSTATKTANKSTVDQPIANKKEQETPPPVSQKAEWNIDYELVDEKQVRREAADRQYIPPTFQETQEEKKPWRNAYEQEEEEEDDGNYNYYNIPIESLGSNRYRNLKTKKEIGEEEARAVLTQAGFIARPNNNLGAAFVAFVAANIMLPYLAPVVAVVYGLFRMKAQNTMWIKSTGNQSYKFNLPSTDNELAANQVLGKIAIGIGVVTAIIRYADLL